MQWKQNRFHEHIIRPHDDKGNYTHVYLLAFNHKYVYIITEEFFIMLRKRFEYGPNAKTVKESSCLYYHIRNGATLDQCMQLWEQNIVVDGREIDWAITLHKLDILSWLCDRYVVMKKPGMLLNYHHTCILENNLQALQILTRGSKQMFPDCFYYAMSYKHYACARFCLFTSPRGQRLDFVHAMSQFDPLVFATSTNNTFTEARWWCEFFRNRNDKPRCIRYFIKLCDKYAKFGSVLSEATAASFQEDLLTLGISQSDFLKSIPSLQPIPTWKDE